ncbi:hypothetical protein SY88_05985 [Clostridiales bacterium PH28_bin88]|nr:hypothetical protein SY88_05985 [Clostridiales bacterium PH28_bin88]
MFDLRYHISSLVAVFLALGIGILVGSTVVGDDLLVQEQKELIDRLEQDFALLREQNRAVQEEALILRQTSQQYKRFAQAAFPLLVQDRLAGMRVAVVKTTAGGDTGQLIQGLESAGAKVESVTILNGEFNFRDPVAIGDLLARLELDGAYSASQLAPRLAWMLGESIYRGQDLRVLDVLRELNVLTSSGNYGKPLDAVLLLGGSQGEKDNYFRVLDLPLIKYFREQQVRVVGTEFSDAVHSYVRYYYNQRVTTVDNVDTIPGITALILALAGSDGHFGIKPTAERMLPETPALPAAGTVKAQ